MITSSFLVNFFIVNYSDYAKLLFKRRNFNTENIDAFKEDISSFEWNTVISDYYLNDSFNKYIENLTNLYKKISSIDFKH